MFPKYQHQLFYHCLGCCNFMSVKINSLWNLQYFNGWVLIKPHFMRGSGLKFALIKTFLRQPELLGRVSVHEMGTGRGWRGEKPQGGWWTLGTRRAGRRRTRECRPLWEFRPRCQCNSPRCSWRLGGMGGQFGAPWHGQSKAAWPCNGFGRGGKKRVSTGGGGEGRGGFSCTAAAPRGQTPGASGKGRTTTSGLNGRKRHM